MENLHQVQSPLARGEALHQLPTLLRHSGHCLGPADGHWKRPAWGQETSGYAILALFIADVLENLCSSLLQYMGYQVFPEQRHCGLAELRARAARRLERRSGAAGFDDLAAVTTKGFREECWKLRARFEFLYGPALWSRMPFWAHLVPTFFAQFHTLLYIICLSNGLSFVLGLCHDNYQGVSRGLLWWPIESPSELCVGE